MENQAFQNNQTPFSFLKGEEFSTSKILSRDSSVGQSSRIYYQNTTNEGVPFKWEMQPGTPINPPLAEIIPPPTPPPAVQSLAIPRPKIVDSGSKDLFFWRFWSWKRVSKNLRLKTYDRRGRHTRFNKHATYSDGDSDAEYVGLGWVHSHSRSSSFSSSSSSVGSHTERFERGRLFFAVHGGHERKICKTFTTFVQDSL